MNPINTDILIIGAGAAGIRAALAASAQEVDVILVSRGPLTGSGSSFSKFSGGWGIQALLKNEINDKNLGIFYDEITAAGLGKCDPDLVRILVEESGSRLEDLISYGIRFKNNSEGNYIRVKGCFSNHERAFLTKDINNIKKTFLSMFKRSHAKFIQGDVVDLIVQDHSCWGALIVTETHDLLEIRSKATILATGGGAGLFNNSFVNGQEIGNGYAVAARTGAELINLEFIQFMLGLKSKDSHQFLPVSSLTVPGTLKDEQGFDVLESCIPDIKLRNISCNERQKHYPFSCRDSSYLLDIAVAASNKKGRRVFWNEEGPFKNTEVIHYAQAFNGGVKINEKAETTINRLFAAGEIAAGPHGADRLGGCMMTATQVFGERAGRYAARIANKTRTIPVPYPLTDEPVKLSTSPFRSPDSSNLPGFLKTAQKSFSDNVMVLRHRKSFDSTLGLIYEAESELAHIKENYSYYHLHLRDMLLVMKLITSAAIKNPQSLGPHYRTDHPPA